MGSAATGPSGAVPSIQRRLLAKLRGRVCTDPIDGSGTAAVQSVRRATTLFILQKCKGQGKMVSIKIPNHFLRDSFVLPKHWMVHHRAIWVLLTTRKALLLPSIAFHNLVTRPTTPTTLLSLSFPALLPLSSTFLFHFFFYLFYHPPSLHPYNSSPYSLLSHDLVTRPTVMDTIRIYAIAAGGTLSIFTLARMLPLLIPLVTLLNIY
jgi:hypothetical protein